MNDDSVARKNWQLSCGACQHQTGDVWRTMQGFACAVREVLQRGLLVAGLVVVGGCETAGEPPSRSSTAASSSGIRLTDAQAQEIGRRIWQNECAGTVAGLTTWNRGEEFPSLGIAHFIWYPEGKRGPFEESFPGLMEYLAGRGVAVPTWMRGASPWKTRAEFMADIESARMKELRGLLQRTIADQARYAAVRLEKALPKMLSATSAQNREKVRTNFYRVAAEPLGLYALMDYVNFKGEGVSPSERYQGQGWGLLQVLETMPTTGAALPEFAKAANTVLTRRTQNAPAARNESKWLPGWRSRLATYTR